MEEKKKRKIAMSLCVSIGLIAIIAIKRHTCISIEGDI